MNPDPLCCSWKELRVVHTKSKRKVSAARTRAVLIYWRDHGLPPDGFAVQWPDGKKTVRDMWELDGGE